MTTLQLWVAHCLAGAEARPTFYAGARKIIRPVVVTLPEIDHSITLSSAGFTTNKLKALTKHYLHKESQAAALQLWKKRRGQENYGSVSFTTFNHFMKGDIKGATPRGSIFGPCLQSIVLTHINKRTYVVDVFYRSTEMFKKFAPDLVLIRDVLLAPFDVRGMRCLGINFHFANVTYHSMYIATLFPHLSDPIKTLERIKKKDRHFYDWSVKWSARYLCPKYEHGIKKFAQALRVQKDVRERIEPKMIKELQRYLTKNHPGYTRTRFIDDENEADAA